jgi:hypothetical protein
MISALLCLSSLQDPTPGLSDPAVRRHLFRDITIERLSPRVDGVVVECRDQISVIRAGVRRVVSKAAALTPLNRFRLSPAEGIARALGFAAPAALARPVWLGVAGGIRAAYRVRTPATTLAGLYDIWVDADSGAVLKAQPVAQQDSARVFVPAPDPDGIDEVDLETVDLSDLRGGQPGDALRGWHFETFNCCKHFLCPDGGDGCALEERQCAEVGVGHLSTVQTQIPVSALPVDLSAYGFEGDTVYMESVFCTEQPRLRRGEDGYLATPVDVTREVNLQSGLDSEVDEFSEVQAYYNTERFFAHLRAVIDPRFCLGDTSMRCDHAGDAVLDDAGNPERAFHIGTNLLVPDFDFSRLLLQMALPPFGEGAGADRETPLHVDDYRRVDNAAFLPALPTLASEVPEALRPMMGIFNRPYDSTLYTQGARDFAYDGDVVFHEFTHAVVWSLTENLGSLWRDEWGAHAEPGALNEGWADFFAASFTGDSVTGNYAMGVLARDADNSARCPDALIGEVHHDSLPWSGALWAMRAVAEDVEAFERVVLMAMAQAEANETMADQARRLLEVLAESQLQALVPKAEAILAERNLRACERVWPLEDNPMPELWLPDPRAIGLARFAPSPVQLQVIAPANTQALRLTWSEERSEIGREYYERFGGDRAEEVPVHVVSNAAAPIRWQYDSAGGATPTGEDGAPLQFVEGHPAFTERAPGVYEMGVAPRCEPQMFYFSLLAPRAMHLKHIAVEAIPAGMECTATEVNPERFEDSLGAGGCGCQAAPIPWLLLLAIALWRRTKDKGVR